MKVEHTHHTSPPYSAIPITKVILRQMMNRISQNLEAPQPLITGRKIGSHSKSCVHIQTFKAFFRHPTPNLLYLANSGQ